MSKNVRMYKATYEMWVLAENEGSASNEIKRRYGLESDPDSIAVMDKYDSIVYDAEYYINDMIEVSKLNTDLDLLTNIAYKFIERHVAKFNLDKVHQDVVVTEIYNHIYFMAERKLEEMKNIAKSPKLSRLDVIRQWISVEHEEYTNDDVVTRVELQTEPGVFVDGTIIPAGSKATIMDIEPIFDEDMNWTHDEYTIQIDDTGYEVKCRADQVWNLGAIDAE